MTYRDLLLPVITYPDPTSQGALEAAAEVAARLGGAVTALTLHVDLPELRNAIANAVVQLDAMVREQEVESAQAAQAKAAAFLETAARRGVTASALHARASLYDMVEQVVAQARCRDAVLLPLGPRALGDVALAEAVLFGGGRPVLAFPETLPKTTANSFATVAVAWDGSRAAARAVADGLPLLQRAGQVRILVITGEKESVRSGAAKDLVRHLAVHGLAAQVDEVPAGRGPIGRLFADYVQAHRVELLVMGGYGHSRAREYVLGGATSGVLRTPPCPVLISH